MWERRGAASAKRAREGLLLRDRAGALGRQWPGRWVPEGQLLSPCQPETRGTGAIHVEILKDFLRSEPLGLML